LYLRLVFTILVSNKDDHLKNHGFLDVGRDRWRMSPVFDVCPAPDRKPQLETAIPEDGSNERSILLALEASELFELPNAEARALIRSMADKITTLWRETFRQHGLTGPQARAYETAFRNDETEIARKL
jgi:serine/threonine-protein kinase HipA